MAVSAVGAPPLPVRHRPPEGRAPVVATGFVGATAAPPGSAVSGDLPDFAAIAFGLLGAVVVSGLLGSAAVVSGLLGFAAVVSGLLGAIVVSGRSGRRHRLRPSRGRPRLRAPRLRRVAVGLLATVLVSGLLGFAVIALDPSTHRPAIAVGPPAPPIVIGPLGAVVDTGLLAVTIAVGPLGAAIRTRPPHPPTTPALQARHQLHPAPR